MLQRIGKSFPTIFAYLCSLLLVTTIAAGAQQWVNGFLRDNAGDLLVSIVGSVPVNFPSSLASTVASNENGSGNQTITECFNHLTLANQSYTANGSTTVFSNTTGKTIRICGFRLKANGAGSVRIDQVAHLGTCSSTGTGVEGPIVLNAAGDGFSTGGNIGELFELAAGDDLCVTIAGFSGTNIWVDISFANI